MLERIVANPHRCADLYSEGINRHLFVPFADLLTQHRIVHGMESDTDHRAVLLGMCGQHQRSVWP